MLARPAADVPGPDSRAAAPPGAEGKGKCSVLVVEDNADARQMLCELFDILGYEAIAAASAKDALPALSGRRVDILLTDHGLPGISGEELARRAVGANRALKVIFASGYGNIETPDFASRSLTKPYRLEGLQAVLDDI